MRKVHAGPVPLVLVLAFAVSACAGGPAGPRGPFGGPPDGAGAGPRPGLFVSPFGETFVGEPGGPWPVADWVLGADENLDGAVDFEEFSADGRRWFARLDTDGDGRLNQAELLAYEAALREVGAGARAQLGSGPRVRIRANGTGPMRYGVVADAGFFNLPQPVKSADVNVDQRVTAEEWAAATQRWFLSLDADRDGKLTVATLPVTPLQARTEARR